MTFSLLPATTIHAAPVAAATTGHRIRRRVTSAPHRRHLVAAPDAAAHRIVVRSGRPVVARQRLAA